MSLAEALEVRGGPLEEEEVWALLSQSAESLQELLRRGEEREEREERGTATLIASKGNRTV